MAVRDLKFKDASLSNSGLLPSGATTVNSSLLDLGNGPQDTFVPDKMEFALNIPALTGVQIPAANTINFGIFSSPNSDGSSSVAEYPTIASVAGSSSPATTVYFKLRQSVNRYLFFEASSPNTTALGATASASINCLF